MATTEKKLTKKDRFIMLRDMVEAYNPKSADDMLIFIDEQIALLDRKRANKSQSPKQKENEELVQVIINILEGADDFMTLAEICDADDRLKGRTPQWASAMMRKVKERLTVETGKKDKKIAFKVGD